MLISNFFFLRGERGEVVLYKETLLQSYSTIFECARNTGSKQRRFNVVCRLYIFLEILIRLLFWPLLLCIYILFLFYVNCPLKITKYSI